jgi:hypothetical protein
MQGLARFKGKVEAPWDEIAIHYVLIVNHLAKDEPVEAFKGQCMLVSSVWPSYFICYRKILTSVQTLLQVLHHEGRMDAPSAICDTAGLTRPLVPGVWAPVLLGCA